MNLDTEYSLKDFLRQINSENPRLKKINALLCGSFRSSKMGIGFDFNEIREYKIGDDLRHISWSTTAKTGVLHTKEYYAEKEITVFFLIDISNSMFCGNKLEPFINLVAYLLNLCSSFSEKIGGLFFDSDIRGHFPVSIGKSQSNLMFQSLMHVYNSLSNKAVMSADYTNLAHALDLTKRYFLKKGLIFLISDFVNLTNWEKNIYEIAKNQNLYSFQIYDPLDFILPKSGYITLVDPETKKLCTVNTDSKILQEVYKTLVIQKQDKLNKYLKSIGVNHFVVDISDFK